MNKHDRKLIKKNKVRFKELAAEEYKNLSETMDRRYAPFKVMRDFKEKHGELPPDCEKQWDDFIVKDGGFLWHEQKKAVEILYEAAKIHALRRLKAEVKNNE